MRPTETETIEASAHDARTDPTTPVRPVVVALSGHAPPGTLRRIPPAGLTFGRGLPLFGGAPSEDGRMSRTHARIERTGSTWTARDCDSRNGTWLNGHRLFDPTRLADGDVLRCGDTVVVFGHVVDSGPAVHGMAGVSPAFVEARNGLFAVAAHDRTVLLLGETGTGKEVAAKALHAASGRTGPFVAVNCASLSPQLLESTLFGHRKGAFTGATDARPGLVRSAAGGTLLLDEVGELPLDLQGRLLRMLETRTVRPVGGTRELPVDVRVVSATNRDLVAAVRDQRFRSDLYARIAQWVVKLPPLRTRRIDLPVLVRTLLADLGTPHRRLDPELATTWALHSWPLNVRGLRNALATATIASPTGLLQATAPVLTALDAERALVAPPEPTHAPPPAELSAADLRDALRTARGKVATAARALGRSRQQVYRLIQAHGLVLDDFRG